MKNFIPLLLISLLLSGCISEFEHHGFSFEQNNIQTIKVGKSNKQTVVQALGSPSTESNFGSPTYYYIGFKTEKVAFMQPKIVEQRVISIAFDKKDMVADIQEYTIDDINSVAFSEHKTEIRGNTLTPIEQIMSNVGKFNKKQKQF